MTDAAEVRVTQADREAAAEHAYGSWGPSIVTGLCDDMPIVQAFARHAASERALRDVAEARCEALETALRPFAEQYVPGNYHDGQMGIGHCAAGWHRVARAVLAQPKGEPDVGG